MIGDGGGVDEGERRAIGDVPDRSPMQIGRLDSGECGRARRAGGVVEERLVAGGGDVVEGGSRHGSFELRPRGDVHAASGDPRRLEAATAADVEARDVFFDERLVHVPARLGRVERGEERVGLPEVVGENEAEALPDVLALGIGVQIRAFGVRRRPPEKLEVERASGGNGAVLEEAPVGATAAGERRRWSG